VDPRPLETLRQEDLLPFTAGIEAGADAVMMAHVSYPAVAPEPAGYSPRWMNEILRAEMGFRGVIFSDDIGMAAAESAGGVAARIDAHLDAGCDVVLVCPPVLVAESLAAMDRRPTSNAATLASLMGRGVRGWEGLLAEARYDEARASLRGSDFRMG
jgi:beta-N-acetylhexosaminidase